MSSSPDRRGLILPGSTIGVLGSGQLGRMFAMAAKHMGYRVHVFSPIVDSPTGQVSDREIHADYHDLATVQRFAEDVDVITLEFENVPVETIQTAAQFAAVHPGESVLKTTQHRIREKSFLRDNGLPVCKFIEVRSLAELQQACDEVFPAVLKTTTMGYDGKGQAVIRHQSEITEAWTQLNSEETILEELVQFDFEFSVIAARTLAGDFVAYDPIRNDHHNHILDVSMSPANLPIEVTQSAQQVVQQIMERLDAVGVLCVEFFMCSDGRIMVNEIAPRPHNSGHLTIDAHETSQFEQQVRAICGLPLGSTRQLKPAAMVNLLGDVWQDGEPAWDRALNSAHAKIHLYGKDQPKPGRKMGHLTVLADDARTAADAARSARESLATQPQT